MVNKKVFNCFTKAGILKKNAFASITAVIYSSVLSNVIEQYVLLV
jgi:hypothetical protein